MTRPKWDTVWMDFAKNIARRSPDPTFKVGCCIVTQDKVFGDLELQKIDLD